MQFDFISWLIGVPTGIGINWLSQWLFRKKSKKFKPKGNYFTATYFKDNIDFEGHVQASISAEEVINKFLEVSQNKSRDENTSISNDHTP